jgi:hypothetical protein
MRFIEDKVALGQVSFEYFGFPCQAFHRLLNTPHYPSSGGWYNKPNSGRRTKWALAPSQETKRKTKKSIISQMNSASVYHLYTEIAGRAFV